LVDKCENILNNVKGCFFCDAVAFPHVNYPFVSKLIDKNFLWTECTSSLFDKSFEKFLLNVYKHTKAKHKKHFRSYPDLSIKEITAIKKILSPIIEDKNKFNNLNTMEWLGIQNIEILEGLYKNPRIMLEGPPGSGKTTVAKAFIDMQYGKTGLFICWNKFLMHFVQNIMKERDLDNNLEVTTFFRFVKKYNSNVELSLIHI